MMIRTCQPSDIERIVRFVYWANNTPEQYSGYCSTTKKIIEQDLRQGFEDKTSQVVAAWCDQELAGLITCHLAQDGKTADCCGPYLKADDLPLAKRIFFELMKVTPQTQAYQFFFSEKNRQCLALMDEIGAVDQGREWIMSLPKSFHQSKTPRPEQGQVLPLQDRQEADFVRLHDQTFPESYVSGQEVIASTGKNRSVYVIEEKGHVIGYGVLRHTFEATTTSVEIIAVREEERGRGLGQKILSRLLFEAFRHASVEAVELVVEANNESAIGLYKKFGFITRDVNCSHAYLRKNDSIGEGKG